MANPRPCVCGHVEAVHLAYGVLGAVCVGCTPEPATTICTRYRKRPRTEPLRAPGRALRRAQSIMRQTGYTPRPELAEGTKVTLRPDLGPARSWAGGTELVVHYGDVDWRQVADDLAGAISEALHGLNEYCATHDDWPTIGHGLVCAHLRYEEAKKAAP